MIQLPPFYNINRRINSIVEIKKKIGTVEEYTLLPKNAVYIHGGKIMIAESILEKKKDFFRKIRSV